MSYKTLADSINEAVNTGDEVTFLRSGVTYEFTPEGISSFLTATPTGRPETITVALSDETTAISAATNVLKFRMPFGMTLTSVKCSLGTAQTSGSIVTVDINQETTSILSTKLTIDNTEKTSTTAAIPAVILTTVLITDAEIEFDIDQVGDGTAIGLKVTLIGTRT